MGKEETISHLISCGHLKSRGAISAMRTISREGFLPEQQKKFAWDDLPLSIGFNQTISAPHMYAIMLEAAQVKRGQKILEIGAGSGYGAALLSLLAGSKGKVYSVETVPQLVESAKANLEKADIRAKVLEGDGYFGFPKAAPYDRILVTAACRQIPPPLIKQLKVGGLLLAPVGDFMQELILAKKTKEGIEKASLMHVLFVPLVRRA